MPVTTQTAPRPIAKPHDVDEIELRMRPGMRVEIEALAAHMGSVPWMLFDLAMQEGCKFHGFVPRASEAELAAVYERQPPADHTENVLLWMRPMRIAQVAQIAASFNMSLSMGVGVVWQAYLQRQGPDVQRAVSEGRKRFQRQESQRVNEPSLDARQQTLAQALAAIAEIAARYPAETFPVDERVYAQLDAVAEWIHTLNHVRSQARSRPPAAVRWGSSARDDADRNAMAQQKYAPQWQGRHDGDNA